MSGLKVARNALLGRMETKLSHLRGDRREILSEIEESNLTGEKVVKEVREKGASLSQLDRVQGYKDLCFASNYTIIVLFEI